MNTTARHVGWRLAGVVPLLFVISLVVFVVAQAGPGDPVRDAQSAQLDPEAIETIRAAYDLDAPMWQQYVAWLHSLATDDGGVSITLKTPVIDVVGPAFLNTLVLGAAAATLSIVVGVLIGFACGIRRGTVVDRLTMLAVQIGSNVPVYWFGLIVIWLFAVQLRLLPASGMSDARGDGGLVDLLRHLVLPAIAASLISMLIIARFVRAATIENVEADYVRTFRSQGFGRRSILLKHVGRNIAPPIVNTAGLTIGSVITGVVFVETIFAWPGIGSVLLNAIGGSDYPVIQAGILVVAVAFVLVNLVTDVVLDLLNPRLRHP